MNESGPLALLDRISDRLHIEPRRGDGGRQLDIKINNYDFESIAMHCNAKLTHDADTDRLYIDLHGPNGISRLWSYPELTRGDLVIEVPA